MYFTVRVLKASKSVFYSEFTGCTSYITRSIIPVICVNAIFLSILHDTVNPVFCSIQPGLDIPAIISRIQGCHDTFAIRTYPVPYIERNPNGRAPNQFLVEKPLMPQCARMDGICAWNPKQSGRRKSTLFFQTHCGSNYSVKYMP